MPDSSEQLIRWIQDQHYQNGDRLPSARQIAEHMGLGRNRLNRLLDILVAQGKVERRGNRYYALESRPGTDLCGWVELLLLKKQTENELRELFRKWGLEIQVSYCPRKQDLQKHLVRILEQPQLPLGVLMWSAQGEGLQLAIQEKEIPMVIAGERVPGISSVSPNPQGIEELAVQSLRQLGHQELVCFSPPVYQPFPLMHSEFTEAYTQACLKEGMETSSRRIFRVNEGNHEKCGQKWREFRMDHPEVTALVCQSEWIFGECLKLAKAEGLHIPNEFSFLCTQESEAFQFDDPPVSTVGVDEGEMVLLAAFQLIRAIQYYERFGTAPQVSETVCGPRFYNRETTAPPPDYRTADRKASRGSSAVFQGGIEWSVSPDERKQRVHDLNHAAFHVDPDQCRPLDLSAWVNRPYRRHKSWLGDLPLKHLLPGEYVLQGVPFRLLPRAIVLKSYYASKSLGKRLPEQITVSLNCRCRHLYFLHTGGWLRIHESFAEYSFVYMDGSQERVPLIPYGIDAPEHISETLRQSRANIGDWSPQTPRRVSADTRPFLVTEKGDPLKYLKFLYVYRWRNPFPEKEVKEIQIRTLHPNRQETLGILAISIEACS